MNDATGHDGRFDSRPHDGDTDGGGGGAAGETRTSDLDPPPAPLTRSEMRASLIRPDLLAAHVLGSPRRIAGNLATGCDLWLLTLLLAGASVVATVPFGAVAPAGGALHVAALFTGSLLICLPCLHVFLQFLGFRVTLARNASLALVISATAGLFTFGFFPILWFIDRTTVADGGAAVTPAGLMRLLLGVSLALGLVQMARCLAAGSAAGRPDARDAVVPLDHQGGGMLAPIVLWVGLFVFIVWRMADVLGLRG